MVRILQDLEIEMENRNETEHAQESETEILTRLFLCADSSRALQGEEYLTYTYV